MALGLRRKTALDQLQQQMQLQIQVGRVQEVQLADVTRPEMLFDSLLWIYSGEGPLSANSAWDVIRG